MKPLVLANHEVRRSETNGKRERERERETQMREKKKGRERARGGERKIGG